MPQATTDPIPNVTDEQIAEPSNHQLLDCEAVQAALACKRTKVMELTHSGQLPSVKIGGSRRWRASDIAKFIADLDDGFDAGPEAADRTASAIVDRATAAHPTLPPVDATLAFLDNEIATSAGEGDEDCPSAELVALARDLLTNDASQVADEVRAQTGCSMLEAMAATFQAVHG